MSDGNGAGVGWCPSEVLPANTSVRTIPAHDSSQRPLTCGNPCADCYRKPVKGITWQSHDEREVIHCHWVCEACYDVIRSG